MKVKCFYLDTKIAQFHNSKRYKNISGHNYQYRNNHRTAGGGEHQRGRGTSHKFTSEIPPCAYYIKKKFKKRTKSLQANVIKRGRGSRAKCDVIHAAGFLSQRDYDSSTRLRRLTLPFIWEIKRARYIFKPQLGQENAENFSLFTAEDLIFQKITPFIAPTNINRFLCSENEAKMKKNLHIVRLPI